jgi:16S rRNA (guanine527-N7)-methyltransferase
MVLAIAGGREVHLVESDLKKIAFLREVARVTKTEVVLHPKRIENVLLDGVDVVTSRACSSLDSLLTYAGANVSHETICLFHKGKNFGTEVEDALRYWDFQYIVVPSVTDTQGVVLKITNILRRGYGTSKVEN